MNTGQHTHDDGCPVCVMCGKHRNDNTGHVDTCGTRCFKALLRQQREGGQS